MWVSVTHLNSLERKIIMSKINHAMREINRIEQLASRNQWVNKIHPLIKLFLTVFYIAITVSFHKYDLFGLIGMLVYLIFTFSLADLSIKEGIWRLRVILPLVCIVGIANPFLDKVPIELGQITVRAGVISMITLMLKGVFAVLASYLFIATTTIYQICYALRLLHVPSILVTQIMLTYRYLSVLLSEVSRITQAYALRAPKQKGVHFKVWGSLTGQLLLRSIDRAGEVYDSMCLRGYQGEFYYMKEKCKITKKDICYLLLWSSLLLLFRKFPIVLYIGAVFGGVG